MDTVAEQLERLFDGPLVPFDKGGYLEPVAELFPAHSLAVLFLASSEGNVSTANHLGSNVDLSLARNLAKDLAWALQRGEFCTLANDGEISPYLAFGVRLGSLETSPILGGLLVPDRAGPLDSLSAVVPVLKVAGRVAWLGTQTRLIVNRQETQIRQLLAEQDTLDAAHTQATAAMIEEHERGLREEQQRQAIAQQCAAIQAANEAKSQFLANMSHEIRTPMTAILGFTEYLLDETTSDGIPPERIEAIRTIQRNGQHLLELINDILDLSKIEANKIGIKRISCSPRKVLADVVNLMRIRAEAKNLALTCGILGGIPQTIQSDELRLKQILINLVGNAIKFTESGSVRLLASLVREAGKPAMLRIDVADTGIGVGESELRGLFQPFSQADSSASRRFGGSGLGLSISRRLAQKLGGDVSVVSTPGKGSTFSVTVETGDLEGVAVAEQDSAAPLHCSIESDKPFANPLPPHCRVLLAEDGPDNRRLIAFFLKKAGAEVTGAEDGKTAFDKAAAAFANDEQFDIILMDMQMPVMDGYEATRRLRALGYTGPIIALTAHAMADDRKKCLDAGCSDYVTKPIDRASLLGTIAQWAARGKAQAAT